MLEQNHCQPIWIDEPLEPGAESTVCFRRRFDLADRPQRADLAVFADSRYVLWVNGRRLGRGPARFDPRWPEYDLYENLEGILLPGPNVLAVLVRHFGMDNFRWIPARPGLWADLHLTLADGQTRRIASDAQWRAWPADAYGREVSKINRQLAANEEFDGRQYDPAWVESAFDDAGWLAAQPFVDDSHGPLTLRSIPMPTSAMRWAGAVLQQGCLQCPYEVHDIRTPWSEDVGHQAGAALVGTFVFSAQEQEVELALGPEADAECWVQGQAVQRWRRASRPRAHRVARVSLASGWNWLVVRCRSAARGHIVVDVGLPPGRGLVVSGIRQEASPNTWWRLGPVFEPHHVEALLQATPPPPMPIVPAGVRANWVPVPEAHVRSDGGLELAWSRAEPRPGREAGGRGPLRLAARGRGRHYALFDLGEPILGHPTLEIQAEEGTVLELAYGERLEPNGRFDPLRYGRYVDRYICRAGRQRWQTFDLRAGRYLLLTAAHGSAEVLRVGMESSTYPVSEMGRFACSDPLLERVWELGRRTLRLCMEDAYTDCPTRERGQWLGDARVEFLANLAAFGDLALQRRGLRQFAQSQTDDGRLAGVYPSRARCEIADYMLLWIASVYDYYRYTGDRLFVESMFPAVQRVLGWFHRHLGPHGLLADVASKVWSLTDWADIDHRGEETTLNAFFYEALRAAESLARLIGGREEAAALYRETAAHVRRGLRRRLWMPRKKRLADARTPSGLSPHSSIHANVLPLGLGMLPARCREPVLAYVKEQLGEMFHPGARRHQWAQRVSPYFMHYVLAALYACDEDQFALDQIRAKYGWMLAQGADCLWENFTDKGSLCHAWSASPTFHLSTKVLGVECLHAGQPRRLTLWPRVADLQWARGTYPHPDGPIQIEWRRVPIDGGLEMQASLPRPLRVDVCVPAYLVDRPVVVINGREAWRAGQAHRSPDLVLSRRMWVQLPVGSAQDIHLRLSGGPQSS